MNGTNDPALESCTIIRFPENIADQIRENLKLESEKLQSLIEKDANDTYYEHSLENRLTVKWNQDKRHCAVKWDDAVLKGRLCDLPTVVEAYKTTDKKTFYKNSSISQILICAEQEKDINPRNEIPGMKDDRRFQLLAGITPPLKNVKKSRFRKVIKKRHCEAPEVERELKRLLREDLHATSVEHELVEDTEVKRSKGSKKEDQKDISDILPMLSSSEEEEDDDDLDDKFIIDPLDRHLKVLSEGVFADKIKKVQDQAQRTADEVLRFRERRAKKEAELEVARKEEKKDNLRNVIEELRRKEDDKTATYHTICEKFKKY